MRIDVLSCSSLVAACGARKSPPTSPPVSPDRCRVAPIDRDGQRDFDLELGAWTAQLRRRENPLTGSAIWASGTSVVRASWGGAANYESVLVEDDAGILGRRS